MASSSLSYLLISIFLIFILPVKSAAQSQSYTNISLGTTFSPITQPISAASPSGDYAFGFRPLDADPSRFLLAVWLVKVAGTTVVWTANGDRPVSNQSKAMLTKDGQLYLTDSTVQRVWSANVNTANYAAMLDTGNFLLAGADRGTLWQTFDHPTDTILPGQVLKQETRVYAKLTDEDYSRGRFALTLQDDGNLVLNSVSYPTAYIHDPYWSIWSTDTPDAGIGMNNLVFNESTGSLYLSFPNGSMVSVFSAPSDGGDSYLRATLDPDGVFRQYSYPKSSKFGTGSWVIKNSAGSEICYKFNKYGSGVCGFNSYCTPVGEGKFNCTCLPHYTLIDQAKQYKGCMPNFTTHTCEPGVDNAPFAPQELTFALQVLPNVDWPSNNNVDRLSPMNGSECQDSCLNDCFCMVAIYSSGVDGGTCWKKNTPLTNGMAGASLVSKQAFIKYSKRNNSIAMAPPLSPEGKTGWKTMELAISTVLGGSVALHLVMVCSFCFVYRRSRPPPPANPSRMSAGSVLCSFTYKELEEATNGFSEELGKGAFGTVYKGALPSEPRTLIAVKKLGQQSLLENAEKDFANEVTAIGQTHHKNLVRLLGFCKEGVHRLLVFEFMSNGPLNKYLFGANKPEWTERVQIALGIAEGLSYLHELCGSQIIHCDIKPQNILLDHDNIAKISDFGMAKLLPLQQTKTRTFVRGTIGYFAPEWFKNVAITAKVDVYSFGVMLLEIICCKKSFECASVRSESLEIVTLVDQAKECYWNRRLHLLVEEDAMEDGMRLERLLLVAISCIQDEPWLRPSMKKVVQMLEGTVPVSIPPDMCSVHQQAPVLD